MIHFLKKIKIDFFLCFLILISVYLCYQNYTPNTFLSGWDTLHPEFNLKQYLGRISSVWQEHQGLGAPPSQAHLAELPRMLIVALLQLIFPMSFVRYGYFFLMIIAGVIGVYFLLKHFFNNRREAAFLGGLFYLLNVGTVQNFIAPLEMFATNFGLLGFLYLFAVKFIEKGKKIDLVIFIIFNLFASSMAHTATLWYVYWSGLFIFLLTFSLFKKISFKKPLLILISALLVNLYWILPNLYYTTNYSRDVITSKIHRLSTEETFLYNKKYGTLKQFALFKNFLFDWRIINNSGKSELLLKTWQDHLNNQIINIIAIGFFLLTIVGAVFSIKKKSAPITAFIPIFLLSSFFLLSGSWPVSVIINKLISSHDFFKEVFRSPFTKFSIYFVFTLSIFFGYIHDLILKKIRISTVYFFVIVILIINYAKPAIRGAFISKSMRVSIPREYFSLFNWSQKNGDGRMLTLPLHNLFGWVYYRWQTPTGYQIYQGAGFTWFGLKQPTLNREFDRWYPYNEQSYRELSYAFYSQDLDLIEKLLQKYQIEYLLLDENVYNPGSSIEQRKLFYREIENLFYSSSQIKLVKKFGEKISVYQFLPNKNMSSIRKLSNIKSVLPTYRWNYIDQAYLDIGNYISPLLVDQQMNASLVYPARNIINERERIDKNAVDIKKDSYEIDFGAGKQNTGTIIVPNLSKLETVYYADIFVQAKDRKTIAIIKPILPYVENTDLYNKEIALKDGSKQISINSQTFLIPELVTDEQIYIGSTVIPLGKDIPVAINGETTKKIIIPNEITGLKLNDNPPTIKGKFPEEQTNVNVSTITNNIRDCGFEKAKLIKKSLVDIGGRSALEYQAQDGDICDTLFLTNLSQNQSYILAIETQNLSGLPFKFCFEDDETKRCVLEDVASQTTRPTTDYFIIPPYHGISHFNLILNNQAIGDVFSINRLLNIQVIPFPYRFFQAIHWQASNSGITTSSAQSVNLTSTRKINRWLYAATLNQTDLTNTVISLNQAYEKNWRAYFIPNSQFSILNFQFVNIYLPFLFGKEIKEHVLVNNWANGWRLRPEQTGTSATQRANITIIFWPQYLEFLGFGLLVIAFLVIIKMNE